MDPRPEINWHRLVRYLAGEYSPEEEQRIRDWILNDECRARRMDELKQAWDATDEAPRSRDVDAAWDEVSGRLGSGVSEPQETGGDVGRAPSPDASTESPSNSNGERKRTRGSRRRRRRRSGWRLFLRVGVFGGMTVAVVLLSVFLLNEDPFSDDPARTFSTKPGERATVHLSDGSKVRLNVDSRLTLLGDFDAGPRTVDLTGEAYFEVARDTTRPFVVHVDGATAEVLGTAFDVRAYADDDEPQVAVAEGAVALRPGRAETQDTVLLRAQHLGIISGPHIQTVRTDTDIERWLAWTNGQLVFEDAHFEEVHRKLERWYDVQIETEIDPGAVDRLNGTFDEESVGKAVKAIAAALDLQYRRDEGSVIFYRRRHATESRSG